MTGKSEVSEMEKWIEKVRDFLDDQNIVAVTEFIRKLDRVEIVDLFAGLNLDDRISVFRCIDNPRKAAYVLHETDDVTREEILDALPHGDIADILDEMPHDDAADVISDLDENDVPAVMELIEEDADREGIRELLKYPEETAGGKMTDRFIAVDESRTVADAIDLLRETALTNQVQVYVTGNEDRLTGIIPINRLATAQRARVLSEIMNTDFVTVKVEDDQEDVANTVTDYDLLAVPVVAADGKIAGIITVDDILDVIKEEATEDMYRMAGTDNDEMIDGSAFWAAKVRLPWLLTTLIGGVCCAIIIRYFYAALGGEKVVLLAFFVPAIMGMGGNIGIQSSTIVVRGLATGRIDPNYIWRVLFKQVRVGILMGVVCGVIVGAIAFLIGENWNLGIIVGVAMFSAIVVAASTGTITPIIFERLNIDPAIAAGPFVTISNDITGLVIYFALAFWLLGAV